MLHECRGDAARRLLHADVVSIMEKGAPSPWHRLKNTAGMAVADRILFHAVGGDMVMRVFGDVGLDEVAGLVEQSAAIV